MEYHELTQNQIDELNEIIQEKIESNDCPYTTSADIRWSVTEDYLREGEEDLDRESEGQLRQEREAEQWYEDGCGLGWKAAAEQEYHERFFR